MVNCQAPNLLVKAQKTVNSHLSLTLMRVKLVKCLNQSLHWNYDRDSTWQTDKAFYTYYVCSHLNFSSLVPLVTRTRSVSNSLKVTPLLPPTKLNTCSVMVMGTHSPKTAAVKTFLLRVLLAEEQSLNASWSLLFSESDTNKKCLTVLGCTNT